jgi:hypothetical protein
MGIAPCCFARYPKAESFLPGMVSFFLRQERLIPSFLHAETIISTVPWHFASAPFHLPLKRWKAAARQAFSAIKACVFFARLFSDDRFCVFFAFLGIFCTSLSDV